MAVGVLAGGWAAAIVVWSTAALLLQSGRWLRCWHRHAGNAVVHALFGFAGWWLVTGQPGFGGLLVAGSEVWLAWRHRNDDDDSDKRRRLWEAAKSRIPRPTVVRLRPVESAA